MAICLRKADFSRTTGARNLDATYHVLLTVTSLNENPVSNSWYLPDISLGGVANHYISWGATVPTRDDDYIYTSFPPDGFVAPYLWFKIFGMTPTVEHLAYFNCALGILTVVILYFLLKDILLYQGHDRIHATIAALMGVLIAIFSREALHSNGIIYWSQCLYQPILAASLYVLLKMQTCVSVDVR